MKKYLFIFCFSLSGILLAQSENSEFKTAKEKGKSIFMALNTSNADMLNEAFSEELSQALTVSKLEKTFDQIFSKYGSADSLLQLAEKVTAEGKYYEQGIQFTKEKLDIIFVLNDASELTTLRIVPYSDKTEWQVPYYANPQTFEKSPIKVGEKNPLLGEFIRPLNSEELIVVVMVHGSGPNDMDESLGPNKLFKDLAYGLGSNNIGSLRYNKRTFDYKSAIAKSGKQLDIDDVVTNDAVKAVSKAKELGADKVILLGHSLGGHLAPKIASRVAVDGVIIMAGNVSPLADLILPQIDYIRKHDSSAINEIQYNQLKWQVENLQSGDYDSTTAAPMLPFGAGGKFWLSLDCYEPQKIAKKQEIPYLIINGGRDYQVSVEEAKKWKDGSKHKYSKTIIYPQLNHLLIRGEGLILPEEYEKEGHLEEKVLIDVSNWITNF